MKELELFLNTKRAKNTRKAYGNHIQELFNIKNVETLEDFKKLNIDDYYEWKNYLLDNGKTENSIRPKLSAISQFYAFLMKKPELGVHRNIIIESGLYENTKGIVNPEHTTWLTQEEIIRFLKACKSPRELAICATFLNTGMRVSELINLEYEKLNMFKDENGEMVSTIVAVRKGGKIQEFYFNSFVTKCLEKYLEIRKETKCKNLFISNGGNAMTTQSIDRTIRKIKNKAGITKAISAHSLRRSAATNMYSSGFRIDEIQDVLGHSSPSTTQIYLKGLEDRAKNVFKNYTVGIEI